MDAQFWEVVKSLGLVGVGAVGVVIAWRQAGIAKTQAETARRKLDLDLFERRYKVFDAAKGFLWRITENDGATRELLSQFQQDTREAVFLFGPEVVEHLEMIRGFWKKIRLADRHLDQARGNDDAFEKAVEKDAQVFDEIDAAEDSLVGLFRPYLNLNQLR